MVQWLTPDPGDWVLPEVMVDWQARMAGCTRIEAEEVLELTVKMMRCEPPTGLVHAGYINILMMFPRELLLPSVRLAIAGERYHVLPTAGALCAHAKAESELRQAKIGQLRRAIGRLELRRFYEDKAGDRSRAARVRGSTTAGPAGPPKAAP